jgi:hypothetical protein
MFSVVSHCSPSLANGMPFLAIELNSSAGQSRQLACQRHPASHAVPGERRLHLARLRQRASRFLISCLPAPIR